MHDPTVVYEEVPNYGNRDEPLEVKVRMRKDADETMTFFKSSHISRSKQTQ